MKQKNPTIGIIGGTGRMGQWTAHFFSSRGVEVLTSGRKTKLTTTELIKKSDIVIVSVPISEVEKTIQEILPKLRKDQLLTDITSLKVIPMQTMEDASCAILGMHPLFGPSVATPINQKIVFCRNKQKENAHVAFLKKTFEDSGMQVIEMSADEHDYHMAYVQALTHAINLMLVKTLLEDEKTLSPKLHTPLFTLQSLIMGRVLQQDLSLMADIQIYNPYFPPILHTFITQAKKLSDLVEKYDKEQFIALFTKDQKLAQNFSHFSMQQTNKLLQLVEDTPANLPEKAVAENAAKDSTIAYLGPVGTYSYLAATQVFPKTGNKKIPNDNIFEIFKTVHDGDVDFGVIPAENSIEGVVRGTLDYLIDFSLSICGSFDLAIHHALLSKEKKLDEIKVVVSHPQAIAQCQKWIRDNLPKAKVLTAPSTAAALQNIPSRLGRPASPRGEAEADQKGYAYIASDSAAKKYKLHVLAKNIQDRKHNETRFYVIAKHPYELKGLNNTKTLLFVTIYNRVGILKDILTVFANHNINLTRLESRPSQEKLWDYHFFVEVERKPNDAQLQKAIVELERYCPVIRILGQT